MNHWCWHEVTVKEDKLSSVEIIDGVIVISRSANYCVHIPLCRELLSQLKSGSFRRMLLTRLEQ